MLIQNDEPFFDFGNDITSNQILVMQVIKDDELQKTSARIRLSQQPIIEEVIVLWEGDGYDISYTESDLETRIREYYDIRINQNLLVP